MIGSLVEFYSKKLDKTISNVRIIDKVLSVYIYSDSGNLTRVHRYVGMELHGGMCHVFDPTDIKTIIMHQRT